LTYTKLQNTFNQNIIICLRYFEVHLFTHFTWRLILNDMTSKENWWRGTPFEDSFDASCGLEEEIVSYLDFTCKIINTL